MTVIEEGPAKDILPGGDLVPVVFDRIVPESRAILSASAGTVDLVMSKGRAVSSVPLQPGMTPLRVTQISTGGSIAATDLWLVY